MTALIFCASQDEALLVMDTMVTHEGAPVGHCSKFHYLPHIRTVFACTGAQGLVDAWVTFLNMHLMPIGIEALKETAPEALQSIWKSMHEHLVAPDGLTATMYHVGFSEVTDEIVIHVFRSTHGFELEALELGPIYSRPEIGDSEDDDGTIQGRIRAMMEKMRQEQALVPLKDRIHIGGQAIAIQLFRHQANIFKVCEFEDLADSNAGEG